MGAEKLDLPVITEDELASGLFVSTEEAGALMGGNGNTFRKWIHQGLPAVTPNFTRRLPDPVRKTSRNGRYYDKKELMDWREENRLVRVLPHPTITFNKPVDGLPLLWSPKGKLLKRSSGRPG